MKLSCHQCGHWQFWILYDKQTKTTVAVCGDCDAHFADLERDSSSGQQVASSSGLDLPPAQVKGHPTERGSSPPDGAINARLRQIELRLRELEASK